MWQRMTVFVWQIIVLTFQNYEWGNSSDNYSDPGKYKLVTACGEAQATNKGEV